jgi:prephenate dehydrogenase
MTTQRIAIVGLGLIGGSLGLALKRSATPRTIVGWDADREATEQARVRGAIDHAVDDIRDTASADVVVVAVPVLAVREVFGTLAPALAPSTVVSDVASTKQAVCGWASVLPCAFVGGHPMAGSERHGIAAARANLFDGATYCLTPTPDTPHSVLDTLAALVEDTGARPYILDADAHDRAVAAVSHLPFMLSAALVDVAGSSPEWALFRALAATGFRDVSRLASGDPRMHRDICLSNSEHITSALRETARVLEDIATHLDDPDYLQRWFEQTKRTRDDMYNGPA